MVLSSCTSTSTTCSIVISRYVDRNMLLVAVQPPYPIVPKGVHRTTGSMRMPHFDLFILSSPSQYVLYFTTYKKGCALCVYVNKASTYFYSCTSTSTYSEYNTREGFSSVTVVPVRFFINSTTRSTTGSIILRSTGTSS
jgi:hypothetical protein